MTAFYVKETDYTATALPKENDGYVVTIAYSIIEEGTEAIVYVGNEYQWRKTVEGICLMLNWYEQVLAGDLNYHADHPFFKNLNYFVDQTAWLLLYSNDIQWRSNAFVNDYAEKVRALLREAYD